MFYKELNLPEIIIYKKKKKNTLNKKPFLFLASYCYGFSLVKTSFPKSIIHRVQILK